MNLELVKINQSIGDDSIKKVDPRLKLFREGIKALFSYVEGKEISGRKKWQKWLKEIDTYELNINDAEMWELSRVINIETNPDIRKLLSEYKEEIERSGNISQKNLLKIIESRVKDGLLKIKNNK